MKRITDDDPGRDSQQVAVIDTSGRSAVCTRRRIVEPNSGPANPVHLGG